MLKIGVNNIISSANLTATNTNPSFPESNAKVAGLNRWQSSSSIDTLTVSFPAQNIQMIVLFNVRFASVTVTGKLSGVTVFSGVYTETDGVDFHNLYAPLSGNVDTIDFAFNGGSDVPYVGYIHIGGSEDFRIESYQPTIESTSQAETTIGGVVETNPGYAYRAYQITIAKNDYTYAQLRNILQPIAKAYSEPRAFVIDYDDCTDLEVMLGVLDSNRISYDIIETRKDGKRTAQVTIGITEINGGAVR